MKSIVRLAALACLMFVPLVARADTPTPAKTPALHASLWVKCDDGVLRAVSAHVDRWPNGQQNVVVATWSIDPVGMGSLMDEGVVPLPAVPPTSTRYFEVSLTASAARIKGRAFYKGAAAIYSLSLTRKSEGVAGRVQFEARRLKDGKLLARWAGPVADDQDIFIIP